MEPAPPGKHYARKPGTDEIYLRNNPTPKTGAQIAASKGLPDTPPTGYQYVRKGKGDVYLRRASGEADNLRQIKIEDGKFVDVETGQTFRTAQEVNDYNTVRQTHIKNKDPLSPDAHQPLPEPQTYIPTEKIEAHLEGFEDGASYLVPKDVLDTRGRDLLGRPDGQFVMRPGQVDDILARTDGDISRIEKELGIPEGRWQGRKLVRIDIAAPRDLDVRVSSGNEVGANEHWLPGGKLPTGLDEAVVDQIPHGKFREHDLF
jgi:hypothetical protein